MKMLIPKDFYENKGSVTPAEMLAMFTDMVEQVESLEQDLNFVLEGDFKYIKKNEALKDEIKELKEEIKQLRRGISA